MIKLIRKYLKKNALICAVFAPMCMLLEVFVDLQMPTLMSNIIDVGVANGDLSYVLATGGRMILYAVLGLVGGVACGSLAIFASIRFGGEVRADLFDHIFTLGSTEIDALETSSLTTRMTSDVTQVQTTLMMMLRTMIRAPLLCIGGVVMSFILSPRLALVLCAALPLLIAAAVLVVRRAVPLHMTAQRWTDRINTAMRENLLGIRVVKALTLEELQAERFATTNQSYMDSAIRAQTGTFILMPIVTLVMNLGVVAILWFGGNMQIAGEIPTGKIMAFVNYMLQIANSLTMLVNLAMNLSRAQASAARLHGVFDTESSITQAELASQPLSLDLELENVSFRYGEGEEVLSDINVRIPVGARIGIIGSTGCGKSTLAALLTRLYDPTEGRVTLGGVDLRDIPLSFLRQTVGLIPQSSLLFSGTVSENLRFGSAEAEEGQLWDSLRAASAEDFIREDEGRLAKSVSQRGSNFSGGQKQRLCIARSMVQSPQILILDDSTSAVDMLTDSRLRRSIRNRMNGATLIFIAQRVSSILDCDSILFMDGGRIAARGTHAELMASCELYRAIARSQLGEEDVLHAG